MALQCAFTPFANFAHTHQLFDAKRVLSSPGNRIQRARKIRKHPKLGLDETDPPVKTPSRSVYVWRRYHGRNAEFPSTGRCCYPANLPGRAWLPDSHALAAPN